MAQVGITLFVDHHFGIVRNHFSLTELIRKQLKNDDHTFTLRHIVAKNISSMCRIYPSKLESLKLFSDDNDINIYIIGLGASDYKSGYNYQMFENHIVGMVEEIQLLSKKPFKILFLNFNITNNLKGNFRLNYTKMSKIVSDISVQNSHTCKDIDIKFLFLNNGDYVVSSKTIPNIIDSICDSVTNILLLK